nr:venom phosphodiesterase-like isoform X2 [Procambarus clarkii]
MRMEGPGADTRPGAPVRCLAHLTRRGVLVSTLLSLLIVVVVVVKVGVVYGSPHHPQLTIPDLLDPASCPPTYHQHPLVLVSLDGFRAEYLRRGVTPTLELLAARGTRAPYMKPSFPTITFPNHYTVVSGLYPSAHGIIANRFYDPVFKAEFRPGRPESFERRWWGGEPIWKTLQSQGKMAATYYWPGSEVEGNHPSYWYYYNESVPFHARVDKVLSWLDLPPETRPAFITLYMHEPDQTGHEYGPYSHEMEQMLVGVDLEVKRLVEGLQARSLLACVNLLVISDHGMVQAGQDKAINLSSFIPNLANDTRFWKGAFGRFTPHDNTPATTTTMMEALACRRPHLRVHHRHLLPVRWHMGSQRRVEDVVLDLDAGYTVGADQSYKADEGDHGYDHYLQFMNALFLGHGPELRRNTEVEAFHNIELYNLMCVLVGVEPAPNNGTWGALHHLLASPPPPPLPSYHVMPPVAEVPGEEELGQRWSGAQCQGDNLDTVPLIGTLEGARTMMTSVVSEHLPWGVPQSQHSTLLLLQPDCVTAYSPVVKLPLWTSFTVSSDAAPWRSDVRLGPQHTPGAAAPWRSDVRLGPQHTPGAAAPWRSDVRLGPQHTPGAAAPWRSDVRLGSQHTPGAAAPWRSDVRLGPQHTPGAAAPWRSDVRLGPQHTPSCPSYNTVLASNVSAHPLFPPEFSSRREYGDLPYLISNALPFTAQLTKRWQQLLELVREWALLHGPLNLLSGSVFDYDADTIADDLATVSEGGGLVVPTHVFLVVTRCLAPVVQLDQCPHSQLDALAFVYPQDLALTNCLDARSYARENSAKVRDVEMIAGLQVFPDMQDEDRLRLQLRIHSNIWGDESWWNRLRTDGTNLSK